jgi:16S rRNA processing protein RimM
LKEVFWEGNEVVRYEVDSVRLHGCTVFLRLAGIADRTAAERLVGGFISVSEENLAKLPDDTYYHFELIGMEVYSETDEFLGKIVEVLTMPANDIWRVEGPRDFLLPASGNVVRRVDREERRVIIEVIAGLIES